MALVRVKMMAKMVAIMLDAILMLLSKMQFFAPMAISNQDTVRSAMTITIFQMMAVMAAEMLLVAMAGLIGENNVMMAIQMTEIHALQTATLFVEITC